MRQLQTKVVGVTFENTSRSEGRESRQRIIEDAARGGTFNFELFWEPENPDDKNAISVRIDGEKIGYLPREIAAELAPLIRDGGELEPFDVEIIGGPLDSHQDDGSGLDDVFVDDPIYGVRFGLRVRQPRRLP